jgi:hypothetical protein
MADCYYHGYSGSGGSCAGCDQEERNEQKPGESEFKYESIPMEVIDKFNDLKIKDAVPNKELDVDSSVNR